MEAVKLVTTRDGAVRFEVLARPRARASRLAGVREGAILVQLAAAPVDGAANAELVAALAQALRVNKGSVRLVRGVASRAKLVEIHGLVEAEIRTRLMAALLRAG